jgi:uncharacterized UPF0160 family protein
MEAKKFNFKAVLTHSKTFHADDVFGVAFCKLINPDIFVYRTVEQEKINEVKEYSDWLVFDIGLGEYDHHQKEGKALRPESDGTYVTSDGKVSCIPYCGFGLLWRDFGHLLCPEYEAWKRVDQSLVLPIDKADNGVCQNLLSSSIKVMNPVWDTETETEDMAFNKALSSAIDILKSHIDHANAAVRAKDLLLENYFGGELLIMDQYLPWLGTVLDDEKFKDVLFAIYPSNRHPGGYNVQTVPKNAGSMVEKRAYFPEEWLGHEDPDRGIHFAHTSNYLIGCDSKEQAIRCAEEAIEAGKAEAKVAYSI